MKKYRVTMTIKLYREVEANSAKEAEAIARDMGEHDADLLHTKEWTAKLIKGELKNGILKNSKEL